MEFEVAPLPYAKEALEPHMSRETLEFHYEKHHKGYMTKLKAAIADKPEAKSSLIDVIKSSSGGVFNNAAQVYNHTFFWDGMKPGGGGAPASGEALDIVNRLGGWHKFREEWVNVGASRFGSGYVWLVVEAGNPKIISTANAETPLTTSAQPLLTCDVWEHAYYIDYRNNRNGFLEVFCDKLINWDFVAKNIKG